MLQTIRKAGQLLDLFSTERAEWSLADLSDELDLPRSSAHALLTSLVDTGLLRPAGRGTYTIGWRPMALAEVHRRSLDLTSNAVPYLQRLVDETGETAQLATLRRGRAYYSAKITGTGSVIVVGPPTGTSLAAHCTAAGKVLLAHRNSRPGTGKTAHCPLRKLTPMTITNDEQLADQLDLIRERGVARDAGEMNPDVRCVAAPVRDNFGIVVAALGLTFPASRASDDDAILGNLVLAAATAFSREMELTRGHRRSVTADVEHGARKSRRAACAGWMSLPTGP